MEKKDIKKSQGGFTLIEIIAVLVILGILAAVAVPRFLDLSADAEEKAFDGACAAVSSNINQVFAQQLLDGESASAAIEYATGDGWIDTVGDFGADSPANPGTDTSEISVTVTHDDYDDDGSCTIANPAYEG